MNHIFSYSKWAQHMKSPFIVCFFSTVDSTLLFRKRRLTASARNGFLHICAIQLADLHKQLFSPLCFLSSPQTHIWYISVSPAGEIKWNQTPHIHLIPAIRLTNCCSVTVLRKWKRINLFTCEYLLITIDPHGFYSLPVVQLNFEPVIEVNRLPFQPKIKQR